MALNSLSQQLLNGFSKPIRTALNALFGAIRGAFLQGSATFDAASLADGVGATTTVTVTGAALGDFVIGVSHGVDIQGISVTGWVSAANTVSVRFQNESGGVLDLASSTLRVLVAKRNHFDGTYFAGLKG